MPDISLCLNDECPFRKTCYRHEADPNEFYQSYHPYAPGVDGICEDYLPLPEKRKKPRLFRRTPPNRDADRRSRSG